MFFDKELEIGNSGFILNFHSPQVGIKFAAARNHSTGLAPTDWHYKLFYKMALAIFIMGGAGWRAEQIIAAVEVVDVNIKCACFISAMVENGAEFALAIATPEKGCNPNPGFKAHRTGPLLLA